MEVKGKVTQIYKNKTAKVMIERASACGGNCHNCLNTCGSKSEIFVKFSEDISVGDTVVISERSNKVLAVSVAVFIVPLTAIVILYKLFFAFTNSDTLSAAIAFFGGTAVFLFFVLIFRKLKMPFCRKSNDAAERKEGLK